MSTARLIHRFAIQTHRTELKSKKYKAQKLYIHLNLHRIDFIHK
jgi:hypothetical protein